MFHPKDFRAADATLEPFNRDGAGRATTNHIAARLTRLGHTGRHSLDSPLLLTARAGRYSPATKIRATVIRGLEMRGLARAGATVGMSVALVVGLALGASGVNWASSSSPLRAKDGSTTVAEA